jgi:hypothetical protein
MANLAESNLGKDNLKNETDVNYEAAGTLAEEHVLTKVKLAVLKLRYTTVGRRYHRRCKSR